MCTAVWDEHRVLVRRSPGGWALFGVRPLFGRVTRCSPNR